MTFANLLAMLSALSAVYFAGMGWGFFPMRKGYVLPSNLRNWFRIAAVLTLVMAVTEYVWQWL